MQNIPLMSYITDTASLPSLWNKLSALPATWKNEDAIEQKSFEILRKYCQLERGDRNRPENVRIASDTARRLATLTRKRLRDRVATFLETSGSKLSDETRIILESNLAHMH